MQQQGDVFLFQTDNGGEINVESGIVEMSGTLETSVYLSLFGGNEKDNGRNKSPVTWWGNLDEIDPAFKYRSETQYILQAIAATTGNLLKIEDAIIRDLQWLLTNNIASSIEVLVSMPGVNRIKISLTIEAQGEESNFEFVENWKAGS